jgi:hypothetical protein
VDRTGAGGATTLIALIFSARNASPRGLPLSLVLIAVIAFGAAAWFAFRQPPIPGPQPAGPLPGMINAVNAGFVGVFVPLGLVLVLSIAGRREQGTFFAVGPFVALALAVLTLNAVMLGAMIRVADWLGTVSTSASAVASTGTLYVYPIIGDATPYVTVGPVLLILAFAVIEGAAFRRAGRRGADEIQRTYQDPAAFPRPTTENDWQYCMVAQTATDGGPFAQDTDRSQSRRWAAAIARARRVARMPRDADKLLTVIALGGSRSSSFWSFASGCCKECPGTRHGRSPLAAGWPPCFLWE